MTSLNPKLIAATIAIAMAAPVAGAQAANTHSLHQARPNGRLLLGGLSRHRGEQPERFARRELLTRCAGALENVVQRNQAGTPLRDDEYGSDRNSHEFPKASAQVRRSAPRCGRVRP